MFLSYLKHTSKSSNARRPQRLSVAHELGEDVGFAAQHSFDTGLTYRLRPNLQLDVAAGVGLNDEAPDFFAGVGISWRWPR